MFNYLESVFLSAQNKIFISVKTFSIFLKNINYNLLVALIKYLNQYRIIRKNY